MVNRIILNETSYFGPGAIKSIPDEIRGRGCKKVMLVTDKDLIKFKVATKVIDLLKAEGIDFEIYQKRAVKAPCFSYGDETAQIILFIF